MNFWGKGIVRSMMIAYKNLFRPVITVQYPHEKVELPERSRWAVAMKLDEEGNHKCTACLSCEKACPDYIIKIDVTQGEDRSKHIDRWRYEIGACMMCGLCVEACPFDAIRMSHEYELARTDKSLLAIDLLSDVPAAKPKRKEPAAAGGASAARPASAGQVVDAAKPAVEVADSTSAVPVEPATTMPEQHQEAGDSPAKPESAEPNAPDTPDSSEGAGDE